MPLQAAGRNSWRSTLNHARHRADVLASRKRQCSGVRIDGRCLGRVICGRIEVENLLVALAIGSKKTYAQTQVQRQTAADSPIVLEIGLQNLVAVVILLLELRLSKEGDSAHQQVSERISGGRGRIPKHEIAMDNGGQIEFVLLGCNGVSAKLKIVLAGDSDHIVPEGVGRVGVAPWNWTRILSETTPIGQPAKQEDTWQLAAKAVIEQTRHGHSRRALPRPL